MSDESLAPCPVCGMTARTDTQRFYDDEQDVMVAHYWIVCTTRSCLCGPARTTLADAATTWNALSERTNLWDAVSGLGRFRSRLLDDGRWCAVQSFASGTKSGFGDTPAAAIVALWAAVQATGEGE